MAAASVHDPLTTHLINIGGLGRSDAFAVAALRRPAVKLSKGCFALYEGEETQVAFSLISGWAVESTTLFDGRTSVLEFLLPGDLVALPALSKRALDCSVSALTDCLLAPIPIHQLVELMNRRPPVRDALISLLLEREAIVRQHAIGLGRRTAYQRITHLLLETYVRLKERGLAQDRKFIFPASQETIGDATGLSTVHVNRTLQQLRGEQSISIDNGWVFIMNYGWLAETSGFKPGYLNPFKSEPMLDRDVA